MGKPILDFEEKIHWLVSNVSYFNILDINDASNFISYTDNYKLEELFFDDDNPRLMFVNSYINDRNESIKTFINGVTTTCDDLNVSLEIDSALYFLI